MSVVTLQFGQCGNQVGQALFLDLYNDIKGDTNKISVGKRSNIEYASEAANKWFHINKSGEWEARSILIDTENKVTALANKNNKNNNNVPYKFKNIVAKCHGGAANNWAYGYSCKSQLLMADIIEGVRKETEKCDFVSSIFSILSSAGGTGSGVGSRTMEVLRDEYPNKTMLNTMVLPYRDGEVVTQNYNSLLTLAKLYDITDATYLYENDAVHLMCTKTLSLTNVTFHDINSIIAQQLSAVLQPVGNVSISRVVANLAAHPRYKFIQVKSAPHVSKEHSKYEALSSWAILVNRVRTSLKSNCGVYDLKSATEFTRKLKCVGNMLISRGNGAPSEEDIKPLTDVLLYVPWLPSQVRLTHFHQNRNFLDLNRFLVLCTNNNSVCLPVDCVLEEAWSLFTSKAFLHHYKKYDIDEQYFHGAFEDIEEIIRNYNSL
ncbi:hypothetical protein ILUMI_08114 [Ignelater luminosus]|uniref:Tubulin delta chain n=1 Tax=Ignelater luminosus TaxID=2038154 RepID=A0A8K0D6Y6_IGNLU|nr:hypothetical protein ILUMI_08114 [Ignelater luminosus]